MREIIFLSFGNFSNYVTSHFWNLNDEAYKNESNPLNLHHECIYDDNDNPRTLLFDYSENIQPYFSLNEKLSENTLQDIQTSAQLFSSSEDADLEVFQSYTNENNFLSMMNELRYDEEQKELEKNDKNPKNKHLETQSQSKQNTNQIVNNSKLSLNDVLKLPDEELYDYFDFNHSIRNWNDFLQAKYCYKSLNELKTVDVDIHSRNSYIKGFDLLKTENFYSTYYETFEDNFRRQLENCDRSEVIHFNVDFNSAWGGINMFFIDHIHQMISKTLKIINAYDSVSSFYKNDDVFDIEKYTNYIWYLTDLNVIEEGKSIMAPIYKNECPSFVKTVFGYESKAMMNRGKGESEEETKPEQNDPIYDYYYSALCSLSLQTLYLPLRSNYYGKSTSLYNLQTVGTGAYFMESDLLFKLDTINNSLPKDCITNGYIMNTSRNYLSRSFDYKKLINKSCYMNKYNFSVLYGHSPSYMLLGEPLEKIMERVSSLNFSSEDLFELPFSFPRKYHSTSKDGGTSFLKTLSVLSNNRPNIDFPLVTLKHFQQHYKVYDLSSKKFLSQIDSDRYFEYKEKCELMFEMIGKFQDFAENSLNEFHDNDEEDDELDY